MTPFLQYIFDISESYRTGELNQRIKDAGFEFRKSEEDEDDKSSVGELYITSNDEFGKSINLSTKEGNKSEFEITLKYYNDSFDEHDMLFIIKYSGITFHFHGEVYENIEKDEYFNLTMCFSNKMISFDNVKDIHDNLDKLLGFTLLYAQDEEIQYGYA